MSSQEENDVTMTQSQDSTTSSSSSTPDNNSEKGKKEKPIKELKRGRGRKPKSPTVLAAKENGAVVDNKEKATKVKRGSYDTYVSYLHKLIKKLSDDENGFKKSALSSLDLILRNISNQFDQESVRLCKSGKVVTVGIKQMRTVTKLLLPGELMKNAIIRGEQAILNFNNSKTVVKGK